MLFSDSDASDHVVAEGSCLVRLVVDRMGCSVSINALCNLSKAAGMVRGRFGFFFRSALIELVPVRQGVLVVPEPEANIFAVGTLGIAQVDATCATSRRAKENFGSSLFVYETRTYSRRLVGKGDSKFLLSITG